VLWQPLLQNPAPAHHWRHQLNQFHSSQYSLLGGKVTVLSLVSRGYFPAGASLQKKSCMEMLWKYGHFVDVLCSPRPNQVEGIKHGKGFLTAVMALGSK
jgi:hypothetical protein